MNSERKVIVVTPWFGEFAGGAERLARGLAVELNRRGIPTMVFTTCSRSPYDNWWEDYYEAGRSQVAGVTTHRFRTNRERDAYIAAVSKLERGEGLTAAEQCDFFLGGINSRELVRALGPYLTKDYEILAVPYFQGLTHAVVNAYPERVSLIPCFHDEPPFYWQAVETLLRNSKRIFFNSPEERR